MMTDPTLAIDCTDDRRRDSVAEATSGFNGIDYVEVDTADHRILKVGFLHPLPGEAGGVPAAPTLGADNVVIEGGERITDIETLLVAANGAELTVTLESGGDFSLYVLRLVRSSVDDRAPDGFDPALAAATFSFAAACTSDLDCAEPPDRSAAAPGVGPVIDYLTKDDETFRRLMLDRIAALVPGRTERNPADPLVTVLEALAHVADRLSYRQDAVATEYSLGTARSRVSVRRHARLLDYVVHDGCTARTWVQLQVRGGSPVAAAALPAGTVVLSAAPGPVGLGAGLTADERRELIGDAVADGAVAFETLHDADLRSARNEIDIHTWGGVSCCLPAGSTRATLVDDPALGLAAGDYLLLEEIRSPATGRRADADPTHRQVVRLTAVTASSDPVEGVDVVEVEWDPVDALRFTLDTSAIVAGVGSGTLTTTAVARGNVVAAHHARRLRAALPAVDSGRWRPRVDTGPVAAALPFALDQPAALALRQDPAEAVPLMSLTDATGSWSARRDLLAADRFDRGFVVEIDGAGRTTLRFGDDRHGRRPALGSLLSADWSSGGGAGGNVGRDVLGRIVGAADGVISLTNPLPAEGGTDAETADHARLHAPSAFLTPERAVTTADWVMVAKRNKKVQHAAAELRWTGSWWTVFLTLDLVGGGRLAGDPERARTMAAELDHYRIAGYDLELRDPVDVAIELRLSVCVEAGHFRADVERALLDELAAGDVDGRRGFFHPDNFTFGQRLYVSQVAARAAGVAGVASVEVTELHPITIMATTEIADGYLDVGALEVLRLDNDPSFPERGILHLDLEGGL